MTSAAALQALAEVHSLVASDGYAATFQSFGSYRTSLMAFITERFTQLKQPMTQTLIQQLRHSKTNRKTRRQAAIHMEELEGAHTEMMETVQHQSRVIEAQQKLLDKCASVLVDGMGPAGLNPKTAAACVDVIRGVLAKLDLTTHENMVTQLLHRIAITAGLPAEASYDPFHVLDQMRLTLAAQAKNGAYLEWALERLFAPGTDTQPPTLITAAVPAAPGALRTFAIDTTWVQALEEVMREAAPAGAPKAEPAPEMDTEPA